MASSPGEKLFFFFDFVAFFDVWGVKGVLEMILSHMAPSNLKIANIEPDGRISISIP